MTRKQEEPMKRYQQRKMLMLVQTIKQAQSAGLYADCEIGMQSISEFIKKNKGEKNITLELIDEYCQMLLKIRNREIDGDLLSAHLLKIEDSIKLEFKPDKIEIAFFPYKSSMFDSLESVYLAAAEDPDCDAYVVPIPYFELNPDGTLGKECLDGLYPDYIPIVDWRKYDLAERHPDIIFIHYAYDHMVNNASIHPSFYSKRLSLSCELLVYIPYFITGESIVDDTYIFLPGILNAHKVILQSEGVRERYIDDYKKADELYGWNGHYGNAEEKFIALGSPKLDKVLSTRQDDCKLPDEWLHLLKKPDGTNKKSILYNTHMLTLSNMGEIYFKKMRQVFDVMRNQDDVILWWRPHPNTELNLRTKHPKLFAEYKALVADYKQNKLGIFDDSSDLHRAIAISDAYYGDGSSVAQLFSMTGKPVLFQDCYEFHTKCYDFSPVIVDFIVQDKTMWFISIGMNCLFSMDLETNSIKLEVFVPSEYYFSTWGFNKIHLIEENIYLIPYLCNHLIKYSLTDKKFKLIKLNENINEKFNLSLRVDTKIFLFPFLYNAIVEFNSENFRLDEYTDVFDRMKKDGVSNFGKGGVVYGNQVYIPCRDSNKVIEYNTETNMYKVHSVGDAKNTYWEINRVGEHLWLIPNEGNIVKWNKKTGETLELNYKKQGFSFINHNIIPFASSTLFEESIFLFPFYSNQIIKINLETDETEVFCNTIERAKKLGLTEKIMNNGSIGNYQCSKKVNDFIYASSYGEKALHKINPATGEIENIAFKFTEESLELINSMSLFGPQHEQARLWVNHENIVMNLQLFLKRLVNDPICKTTHDVDELCGGKILNFVKQEVNFEVT